MKQTTFASLAFDKKKKQTRRERFLAEMEAVGKRRPAPVLTPQTFSLSKRSFTSDKSKRPGSKSSPHHARIS